MDLSPEEFDVLYGPQREALREAGRRERDAYWRARARALIVRACEEAWNTPGDEWGIKGRPETPIKTSEQIANEIADRLLAEEKP